MVKFIIYVKKVNSFVYTCSFFHQGSRELLSRLYLVLSMCANVIRGSTSITAVRDVFQTITSIYGLIRGCYFHYGSWRSTSIIAKYWVIRREGVTFITTVENFFQGYIWDNQRTLLSLRQLKTSVTASYGLIRGPYFHHGSLELLSRINMGLSEGFTFITSVRNVYHGYIWDNHRALLSSR